MAPNTPPPAPAPFVEGEKLVPFAVDAWKTTVSVQQHFNDLELRIRNFAITFATAVLGLVGFALKEYPRSLLPVGLLFVGGVGWIAFYVMDRFWYHRFLEAAGEHAGRLEKWLADATGSGADIFNLSGQIKIKSGIPVGARRLRSKHRIDIFYGAFLVAGAVLASVFYSHAWRSRNENATVEAAAVRGGVGTAPAPVLPPPATSSTQVAPSPQPAAPAPAAPPRNVQAASSKRQRASHSSTQAHDGAAVGCTKDTDCKGDRICRCRECVDALPPPGQPCR